jgi:hypothetical protein
MYAGAILLKLLHLFISAIYPPLEGFIVRLWPPVLEPCLRFLSMTQLRRFDLARFIIVVLKS